MAEDSEKKIPFTSASDLTASMIDDLCRRCLARPEGEWSQAVSAVCLLYPEHETAIRDRFDALRRATPSAAGGAPAAKPAAKAGTDSFFVEDLDALPETPKKADALPGESPEFMFAKELGRGGMGIVYEARDKNSGRKVAVKVVSPHLEFSASAVERFEREARIAARMSHPNCVFVYGAHRVEGRLALSMELMTGRTLEDVVREKRRIPPTTIVQWAVEILMGLEAAHSLGIVHRDIKPSNIFLDAHGHVKIGDFGLSLPQTSDLRMTRSGMFLGSPMYASPEQIRARDVDQRSDVYSVGATLYAVVTGEVPHEASNIGDLFARITTEEVRPPWEVRDDCPRDLGRVILRALEKDPAKRFASAAEMRMALLPFMAQPFVPAPIVARTAAYFIDVVLFSIVGGLIFNALQIFDLVGGRTLKDFLPWIKFYGGFAIRILYFSAFETLLEASPGKAIFGLRVARENGERPSWRDSLVRAVAANVEYFIPVPWLRGIWDWSAKAANLIGIVVPISTMRRSNGFMALHDRLSGTRVVQKRSQPIVRFLHRGRPLESDRGESVALGGENLGAYRLDRLLMSTASGRLFAGRDTKLDREVWIHVVRSERDLLDKAARSRTDAGRLRWLDGGESPRPFDVFESPGGASLLEYEASRTGLVWGLARAVLLELAQRLARGEEIRPSEVWIDRAGALKLLDFESDAGGDDGDVLAVTARSILPKSSSKSMAALSMPAAAVNVVKRLRGEARPFGSAVEVLEALRTLDVAPRPLTRIETTGIYFVRFVVYAGIFLGVSFAFLFVSTDGFVHSLEDRIVPWLSNSQLYELACLAVAALPAFVSGILTQGGLVFRWIGVKIVDRDGNPASSTRAAVRTLIAWLPAFYAMAMHAFMPDEVDEAMVIAGLIYVTAFIFSVVRPSRGLADIITRTYVVR